MLSLSYALFSDFFVVGVYHIVAVGFIAAALRRSAAAHIRACLAAALLCLLIHLREQFLGALHHLLLCSLDVCHLSVCKLGVFGLVQKVFQRVQVSLYSSLVVCLQLVAGFLQSALNLEYHGIRIVSGVDRLCAFLILRLELSRFFDSLVDLSVRHIGTCGNGDMLLLACSQVFGRYVYNTVGVDIESNLDLRNAAACRRDSVQTELTERLVVSCELTLALYHVDVYCSLVVCRCGEDLALLCRNRCISLDQTGCDTSHCLNGQRQRSDIQKKD